MLRDDIARYTELTGEDGEHTSIQKIGAYLDGYEQGKKDYGRPKGEWVRIEGYEHDAPIFRDTRICPECRFKTLNDWNFCPNCGADCRGDKE